MPFVREQSGGTLAIELIGEVTSGARGNNTMNLTKSISDYKYVVPIPANGIIDSDLNLTSNSCDIRINSTEYFKSNTISVDYFTGASGSIVKRSYVYTYVDDTTVTVNIPSGGAPNPQLFGIK